MPSLLTLPITIALPPILLIVSFPLVILAAFTTYLAFATLAIRLSIVYVELGGALLRAYLFPPLSKTSASTAPALHVSASSIQLAQRRRSRRGSVTSQNSTEQLAKAAVYSSHHRDDSLASLLGAGGQGLTRDYEGIGGWRDEDDDLDREAIWLSINKRLELPAAPPARWHRRSGTGSSAVSLGGGAHNAMMNYSAPVSNAGDAVKRLSGIWSPETLRMSPVQSRARTPSVTDRVVPPTSAGHDEDEYFGITVPKASFSRRKSVDVKDSKIDRRKSSSSGESVLSFASKTTVKRV